MLVDTVAMAMRRTRMLILKSAALAKIVSGRKPRMGILEQAATRVVSGCRGLSHCGRLRPTSDRPSGS